MLACSFVQTQYKTKVVAFASDNVVALIQAQLASSWTGVRPCSSDPGPFALFLCGFITIV
jgi:hypothetical protein